MRKLHFGLWLAGGFILLVSAPAVWWEVTLVNGVALPVRGIELSALATTLVAVSSAAFAAGTLFRGVSRRLVAALSGLSAAGAGIAVLGEAARPEMAIVEAITLQTGISGSGASNAVAVVTGGVWAFVALVGLFGMLAGSVVGVTMPDPAPRTSRYERGSQGSDTRDSVATWDTLSDGVDPTKR